MACGVCEDGKGFRARACPGCGNQKPLDLKHALIYNLPVGALRNQEAPVRHPAIRAPEDAAEIEAAMREWGVRLARAAR